MLPQFGYVFAQAGADRNSHNLPLAPPIHQYSNEPPSQKYQQQQQQHQQPPPPPHATEFTPPPSMGFRDSQREDPYYEHMPPSYSAQHPPAPPPPTSSYPPYTQVDPYQSHVEGYRGSEPPYHNHVSMKVYNQMDEPVYRYEEEQRWHADSENYQNPYHDQRQAYAQDWSDGKFDVTSSLLISISSLELTFLKNHQHRWYGHCRK